MVAGAQPVKPHATGCKATLSPPILGMTSVEAALLEVDASFGPNPLMEHSVRLGQWPLNAFGGDAT